MHRVHHHKELSAQIRDWKRQGKKIAFVPTMGNLHQGHLSLLKAGKEQADKLVSSIFVNPMQFGPNEDLNNYPRTLEKDCKALMEHGCDLIYLPTDQDLYPHGLDNMTQVRVSGISEKFEGEYRPGHLTGVSTIVLKLFHLTQPDIAVFGKKDYQQWRMIEKMVEDLNLNIDIMGGNTVRESDGLAMSSRNQYLTPEQRTQASQLHAQLSLAAQQIRAGELNFTAILEQIKSQLAENNFVVDYIDICHQQTLQPAQTGDPMVILAAARLGKTRLIDNLEI
jgi:pantoate--beta-alanine ligase